MFEKYPQRSVLQALALMEADVQKGLIPRYLPTPLYLLEGRTPTEAEISAPPAPDPRVEIYIQKVLNPDRKLNGAAVRAALQPDGKPWPPAKAPQPALLPEPEQKRPPKWAFKTAAAKVRRAQRTILANRRMKLPPELRKARRREKACPTPVGRRILAEDGRTMGQVWIDLFEANTKAPVVFKCTDAELVEAYNATVPFNPATQARLQWMRRKYNQGNVPGAYTTRAPSVPYLRVGEGEKAEVWELSTRGSPVKCLTHREHPILLPRRKKTKGEKAAPLRAMIAVIKKV